MTESKENLKSFLRMKEKNEKAALKFNIKNTKAEPRWWWGKIQVCVSPLLGYLPGADGRPPADRLMGGTPGVTGYQIRRSGGSLRSGDQQLRGCGGSGSKFGTRSGLCARSSLAIFGHWKQHASSPGRGWGPWGSEDPLEETSGTSPSLCCNWGDARGGGAVLASEEVWTPLGTKSLIPTPPGRGKISEEIGRSTGEPLEFPFHLATVRLLGPRGLGLYLLGSSLPSRAFTTLLRSPLPSRGSLHSSRSPPPGWVLCMWEGGGRLLWEEEKVSWLGEIPAGFQEQGTA